MSDVLTDLGETIGTFTATIGNIQSFNEDDMLKQKILLRNIESNVDSSFIVEKDWFTTKTLISNGRGNIGKKIVFFAKCHRRIIKPAKKLVMLTKWSSVEEAKLVD